MSEDADKNKTIYDVAVYLVFHMIENRQADEIINLLRGWNMPADMKNDDGMTILMKAAEKGEDKLVAELIEHGADINALNDDGQTALMVAFAEQETGAAEVLLDKGARADITDHQGRTTMMLAVDCDASHLLKRVVKAGGQITDKAENGNGLLIRSLEWEDLAAAAVLVELGCDPNETGLDGYSALSMAMGQGKRGKDTAMLLLDRGASVHADTHSGVSLLRMAVDLDDEDLIRRLCERGAKATETDDMGRTLEEVLMKNSKLQVESIAALCHVLREAAEKQRQQILKSGLPVTGGFEGLTQISAEKSQTKLKRQFRP